MAPATAVVTPPGLRKVAAVLAGGDPPLDGGTALTEGEHEASDPAEVGRVESKNDVGEGGFAVAVPEGPSGDEDDLLTTREGPAAGLEEAMASGVGPVEVHSRSRRSGPVEGKAWVKIPSSCSSPSRARGRPPPPAARAAEPEPRPYVVAFELGLIDSPIT